MYIQGLGHHLFDKSIGHFKSTFAGTMMSPAATSPLDDLACRLLLTSNSTYGIKGGILATRMQDGHSYYEKARFAEDVPMAVMVSGLNNIDACLIGGTGYMRAVCPGVC